MKYLKVKLWGEEIGRLVWDAPARRSYFVFNPDLKGRRPDVAPILSPLGNSPAMLPLYGDDSPLYQGLPPFIADSLPDAWGNALFDQWVRENRIPRNRITPLYKLTFIGTRGMGALEYEPCAEDLAYPRCVDVKSLYDMSLRILGERDTQCLSEDDTLTLQALLAVGTSAGGRQMKAIIAVNPVTGEIRSGQTDGLADYEYGILKFGDTGMPMAEVEMAYHDMAVAAGIEMEKCRLLSVEGVNHFLTNRFDRKNGVKIHMQTLAAMNPEARTYEDLFDTCRMIGLGCRELTQLYVRMVFNVLANNTDDHNKNFAFLLEKGGKWRLSPAYDVTFIFNPFGNGPNMERCMSLCGKISDITRDDLLEFAVRQEIKDASGIVNRVATAIRQFDDLAKTYGIIQPWRGIISRTIRDNLMSFGLIEPTVHEGSQFTDHLGRIVTDWSISVNSKGRYEVSACIDGIRRRRFIKPQTPMYDYIGSLDINDMTIQSRQQLIGKIFPS